jgi:hypothetical protein
MKTLSSKIDTPCPPIFYGRPAIFHDFPGIA